VSGRTPGGLFSAQQARTLYALADALLPPGPPGESAGGGSVDIAPRVEARLADAEREKLWQVRILLLLLEWRPRLELRDRRGFAWLSRAERLRLLEAFEHSAFRGLRRLSGELRSLVLEAAKEALNSYSLPGA
jgi:hypothetical protein